MYSRKAAFTEAKKLRTCPPAHLRDHPRHQSHIQKHLEICPHCSFQIKKKQGSWNFLEKQPPVFKGEVRESVVSTFSSKILAGQFRYIRSDLGKWENDYFYNPPLILVLEAVEDGFQVAQTYNDIVLAAPGDLILTNEHTSNDPLFIESWNTYTVNSDHLESLIDQVSLDIVELINTLKRTPQAYPPWALHPRPIYSQDIRIYFRELELNVAQTFSNQSIDNTIK